MGEIFYTFQYTCQKCGSKTRMKFSPIENTWVPLTCKECEQPTLKIRWGVEYGWLDNTLTYEIVDLAQGITLFSGTPDEFRGWVIDHMGTRSEV